MRIASQLNIDYASAGVCIFLLADGVNCAIPNQLTPNGYFHIGRMLELAINRGTRLLHCGSCPEARCLKEIPLMEKAGISTMAELAKRVMDLTGCLHLKSAARVMHTSYASLIFAIAI